MHYFAPTVQVVAENRLRVTCKDARHSLTPGLDEALWQLTQHLSIRDLERRAIDGRQLAPDALEQLQHELFRSGQHEQIVKLVRKRHRWNRKRAEAFVEELSAATQQ